MGTRTAGGSRFAHPSDNDDFDSSELSVEQENKNKIDIASPRRDVQYIRKNTPLLPQDTIGKLGLQKTQEQGKPALPTLRTDL